MVQNASYLINKPELRNWAMRESPISSQKNADAYSTEGDPESESR